MEHISFKLLEVFALGLGQPAKALYPLFDTQHTSFLRLNYYPVTPNAEPGSLGISDHKDAGFLTVLVQDDVPGLQVWGWAFVCVQFGVGVGGRGGVNGGGGGIGWWGVGMG